VAQAFDLGGTTNKMGAPSFAFVCEGREAEMPAPCGFDHASTTKSNSTRSIAAHPFGKLRAGSCKKRKDEPPSVGMVQARIAKGEPPAKP
jgi:hypothetical protein